MQQPDYSDLWKFMTSVGAVLLVISVAAPIALQSFGVSVLEIDITDQQSSEASIHRDQLELRALRLNSRGWIPSGLLFLCGGTMLVSGLIKWRQPVTRFQNSSLGPSSFRFKVLGKDLPHVVQLPNTYSNRSERR